MGNLWGSLNSSQAVQMGMNIFNMAQQQALQKQNMQREQEQLERENSFKKQQLDMQQQRIDFEGQRIEQQKAVNEQNIQTAKDRSDYYKMQKTDALETKNKLNEYSIKLGEMLETLDFSSPDDMKKLYAFQTQYSPYGVNAQYIKPVAAGGYGGMDQDEYGKFVKDLYIKIANTSQNKYNKEHQEYLKKLKDWEAGGIFGFGKGEKPKAPEFGLPDVDQVKKIADQMLQRGIKIEDLVNPKPDDKKPEETLEAIPEEAPTARIEGGGLVPAVAKTLATGGMYPTIKTMQGIGKTVGPVAKDVYSNIASWFKPSNPEYESLSQIDKNAIDKYMANNKNVTLEYALNMLKESRRAKAQ